MTTKPGKLCTIAAGFISRGDFYPHKDVDIDVVHRLCGVDED